MVVNAAPQPGLGANPKNLHEPKHFGNAISYFAQVPGPATMHVGFVHAGRKLFKTKLLQPSLAIICVCHPDKTRVFCTALLLSIVRMPAISIL